MSKKLIKGEKIKLADILSTRIFEIGVTCEFYGENPAVSCFGIDNSGILSDARYLIFHDQKNSPENAIISFGSTGSYNEVFRIDLDKLPAKIERLVFVATLGTNINFSNLKKGQIDLIQANNVLASYEFLGSDFLSEQSVIIGEIYTKSSVWRMSAVGQGFNGGLDVILKHFGVEEAAFSPVTTNSNLQNQTQPVQNTQSIDITKSSSDNDLNGSLYRAGGAEPRNTMNSTGSNANNFATRSDNQGVFMSFLRNIGNSIRKGKENLMTSVSKYKNATFMEAVVASTVLIAFADGKITADEKQKLIAYVQHADELKAFQTDDILKVFNKINGSYEFDALIGKAEALKLIGKLKDKEEQARLIVRVAIAIANADGTFDDSEKQALGEICTELKLNVADFL